MTDVKSWLQSRTIWAVLVTLSPILTQVLGFNMDATLADILTVVGAGAAIYFRIAATKKLS
tara:strand:- start:151 stop:333 length:183 start_codon:yes stop_codon:yes gene_type:complete